MPKTREQMIARTLQVLNVASVGNYIAAEDADVIDLDAVAEMLYGLGYADLRNDVRFGTLNEAYFVPFCNVLAANHAHIFGTDDAKMSQLGELGKRDVQAISQRTEITTPLRIEFRT